VDETVSDINLALEVTEVHSKEAQYVFRLLYPTNKLHGAESLRS
jgi:hypothetical protein